MTKNVKVVMVNNLTIKIIILHILNCWLFLFWRFLVLRFVYVLLWRIIWMIESRCLIKVFFFSMLNQLSSWRWKSTLRKIRVFFIVFQCGVTCWLFLFKIKFYKIKLPNKLYFFNLLYGFNQTKKSFLQDDQQW